MSDWRDLDAELDAWSAAGRTASLWWRDDDAADACAALDRLLAVSAASQVAVTVAAIPARATAGLARALGGARAGVVQHGFAHVNHAPADQKRCELGTHRDATSVARDLEDGQMRLRALFPGLIPALVPPWNRIAPAWLPRLPGLGFSALSTFGPREHAAPVRGLSQTNSHVDIIDWRGGRGFVGDARALAALTRHLAARRGGAVDAGEPTGVLTHHLDHDEACWEFLTTLLERATRHPGATWLSPAQALAP